MTCPVKTNDQTECPEECVRNKDKVTIKKLISLETEILQKKKRTGIESYYLSALEEVLNLYNQIRGKVNNEPDRSER